MTPPDTQAGASAVAPGVKLVATKELKLPTGVFATDCHSDGKRLYAACLDGGIYEVTVASGEHKLLGKHESYASGVRYLPKSAQLVSAGYDGALRWFDPATGNAVRNVAAHKFWSWKMRVSPDERWMGTVTGQYLVGGYKYEPAAESEPSVKVYEAATGKLRLALSHVPPVLSVAFSPDSRHLAAANMMGEVRVWELETGKQVASWTTPDFTCWGIIKSHHYIGGIYDLTFSPDGHEVLVCGMGPMVDPMAGNGKQTWQRFAWTENPPRKVAEIREADAGHGLMEVVRYHPDHKTFIMAGRLAQGKWNTALFDSASGNMLHSLDTGMRVMDAAWLNGGAQLALSGATGQERKVNGRCPDFGRIKLFELKS
jgi:hypothetical protein